MIYMKKNKAFTMIELLMVMIIIGILTSLVTTGAFRAIRSAKEDRARSDIAALEAALERYKLDTGQYPQQAGGGDNSFVLWLETGDGSTGWDGSYMRFDSGETSSNAFLDPWGRAYQYQCPGTAHGSTTNAYDVWSKGKDGTDGSGDDIDSWN
jgi:general secretion pathway protein G